MILLYDTDRMLIGPIETAIRVGYDLKLNDMSTATLVLPFDDPMTERIDVPSSWARIYDGERNLGFFRFASIPDDEHAPQGTITYSLQGAECTLLDDDLIGWHEIGGAGLDTRWVMDYILSRQSEGQKRWTLGRCDFKDHYQYNFEDTTLLESLMSLGEVLLDGYRFVFDSTSDAWTASLVRLPAEAKRSLTYGRNTQGIRRSVDRGVVTRLYGRGYGEGDNQLTIASVNGGRDYLDADAETMRRRGVRVGIHVDTRQTDPATLKAHMARILEVGKHPAVCYEADAIDLWRETGEAWDDVGLGDKVLVLDTKLGEPVSVRVTAVSKEDIDGDPGRVRYTLDNSRADTAEELNEIREKIGIHELYSQGATNMYSMQIADNADKTHPLTMRFYVPGNVLRINSCLMRWQLERFRTYATLAKSGGESTRTSQSGGGATVTIPQMTTSVGVTYSSQPMDTEGSFVALTGGTKNLLGNAITRTESDGAHAHSMTHTHITPAHTHPGGEHSHRMVHAHVTGSHDHGFSGEAVSYNMGHNHSLSGEGAQSTGGIDSGIKSLKVTAKGSVGGSGALWTGSPYDAVGGSVKVTTDKASAATGKSDILWVSTAYEAIEGAVKATTGKNGAHTHPFFHAHDMPHVHNIAHEHIIPSMRFDLEPHTHSVTIPAHTHELEYGVYEGARAESLAIRVDGENVPSADFGESMELDVAKYMRKNSDGKVTRASWHTVDFVPSGLTRITANLFFQVFIQSRGAGDY